MRWIANLKTAYKLGLGFGLGIVITLIIGLVSLTRMASIADALSNTGKDEIVVEKAGQLRGDILAYQKIEKDLIIEDSEAEMLRTLDQMDKLAKEFEDDLADMKGLVYTEKGRAAVADLEQTWQAYLPVRAKVGELARAGKDAEAHRISKTESHAHAEKIDQLIDDFTRVNAEQAKKTEVEAMALVAASRTLVTTLVICSALLGRSVASHSFRLPAANRVASL